MDIIRNTAEMTVVSAVPWLFATDTAKSTASKPNKVVNLMMGFKATELVSLNPIIKFTTLFGLLAVDLAVSVANNQGTALTTVISAVFLAISLVFAYRSFYRMRIE